MDARFKHKVAIGATALAAVGFAGGAYAATHTATSSRQAFLNDVAKRLNVTPDKLRAAMQAGFLDRLNAEVKAGRLTQAQADRLKQRIEQGKLPLFLGPHRHRFAAAAKYLGLSDAQLITELRSGKSLAQIASAQGKTTTGLEQAMVASRQASLDKAVAAGRITKAQEQELLSRYQTRLSRLVNRKGLGHRTDRLGAIPPGGGAAAAVPGGAPPAAAGPGGPPPAA
jgi:hypothetical protein